MTQPMMPPPLPGYPAAPPPQAAPVPVAAYPAPAYPAPQAMPAPTPQGYPGPPVAAPQPAYAPQPSPAYAAPAAPPPAYAPQPAYAPAPQPQPAYAPQPYAQPAPAYAPAPAPGYAPQPYAPAPAYGQAAPQSQYVPPTSTDAIGDAIAAATGGDRVPPGEPGVYLLEVIETRCTRHPVEGKLTFKATFRVVQSSNPSFPQGAEIVYLEGLKYSDGGVRAREFLVVAQGYPSRIVYDQTMAAAGLNPQEELRLFMNATGNPERQLEGNRYPANPLRGRQVAAVIAKQNGVYGPRSPKAGQPKVYTTWKWSVPGAPAVAG